MRREKLSSSVCPAIAKVVFGGVLAEVSWKESFEGERSGCSDFIGKVFPGLKESWGESESVLREGAGRRVMEAGGAKVMGQPCAR